MQTGVGSLIHQKDKEGSAAQHPEVGAGAGGTRKTVTVAEKMGRKARHGNTTNDRSGGRKNNPERNYSTGMSKVIDHSQNKYGRVEVYSFKTGRRGR